MNAPLSAAPAQPVPAQPAAAQLVPAQLAASLVLAEKSVPRYTSYPTAPHFHAGVTPQLASGWLAALPADARLSLYLHVPYCKAICNYCGCNTKAALRDAPLDAYVATLLKEIDIAANATQARRVSFIHWGGGTPSLLGPDRLAQLWATLGARFDLSHVDEHAIELDPRTVDKPLADGLAAIGVNRVSFGVQDLNAHVQQAIGRVQPFEIVERAVQLVRAAGISAVNLDLMYGLPEQSMDDVERTAHLAASLDPSRLAIFGYAHVPWFKSHQRLIDVAALPGAAARIAQAAAARSVLAREGYRAIGLDHFARETDALSLAARAGLLRRNFQGYVNDDADALIGLGASSIGQTPHGFTQNAPDVAGWRRMVETGELPVVRGVAINDDDRLRAAAIERLMCDFALDFGALSQRMAGNEAALDDAIALLDDLDRDGVLVRAGRTVRITPAGEPFVRLAAAAFDTYLRRDAARHSAAV
ncbi:MAG: oxygen-independent coproporphyrinogen III oxidase [Beijerinckiaceae bacterium]|nr:oxygen-independent coproporphyrinogen III oxidase [Beijerinckiaceae bacterium]